MHQEIFHSDSRFSLGFRLLGDRQEIGGFAFPDMATRHNMGSNQTLGSEILLRTVSSVTSRKIKLSCLYFCTSTHLSHFTFTLLLCSSTCTSTKQHNYSWGLVSPTEAPSPFSTTNLFYARLSFQLEPAWEPALCSYYFDFDILYFIQLDRISTN